MGQEHVVRALRHALEQKRLHHAYLFTGTRGVGKTTLARILAKCLNCETGITPQPCNKCSACAEIDAGRFVDLLEVDAATNTKVDEMRQLLDTAQYAPTRGRFKVYVIDEVHQLSGHAFNAMLKTLEEPPEHMKFILATTDPQKIPVTVLSRCLQFNLKQMPRDAIAAHLASSWTRNKSQRSRSACADRARGRGQHARRAVAARPGDRARRRQGDRGVRRHARRHRPEPSRCGLLEAIAAGDAAGRGEDRRRDAGAQPVFDTALAELASLLLQLALAQSVPRAVDDARVKELAGRSTPSRCSSTTRSRCRAGKTCRSRRTSTAASSMTVLRMLAFRPEGAAKDRCRSAADARALPRQARARRRLAGARPAAAGQRRGARARAQRRARAARGGWPFELVVPKAKAYLAERSYDDKLKAALEQQLGVAGDGSRCRPGEVAGGERRLARGGRAEAAPARPRRRWRATASCRTSSTSSTARSSIPPSGKIESEPLMKGNIGQLMKQAQQMQENMRRMQESLATTEVEGQSGAGHGEGADDLQVRGEARDHRSLARRRRPRDAGRPGRRRVQRRRAPGRGHDRRRR